jgi:hypothetical protein
VAEASWNSQRPLTVHAQLSKVRAQLSKGIREKVCAKLPRRTGIREKVYAQLSKAQLSLGTGTLREKEAALASECKADASGNDYTTPHKTVFSSKT